jgi:hypothetical protein
MGNYSMLSALALLSLYYLIHSTVKKNILLNTKSKKITDATMLFQKEKAKYLRKRKECFK